MTPISTVASVGIGARPGALAIPKGSPPPVIRLVEYDADALIEREISDIDELRAHSATVSTTWVDIQGLGDADAVQRVADIFGIHRLALADAVNAPQRPKADSYADHLLIVGRAPLADHTELRVAQVGLLVSDRYLLSFQERYFGYFDAVRQRLRAGNLPIRSGGPGYLAYALVDALVDHYYPWVEEIAEEIDELEIGMLANPTPERVAKLHALRTRMTLLRRVARPQREALYRLSHEQSPFITDETRVFLRDTHDHASQILDLLDSSREMASDLMNTALTMLGHRSNEVMKVLTLMASIFIPLTFIAGIYGMNFEYMPELANRTAYPMVLVLMVSVAVGMLVFFRRRGWLGGGSDADDPE